MKILKLISIFIISTSSYALYELSLDFSYKKHIYGAQKQNKQTTRGLGGSLVAYMLSMTAIEFNYSESDEITIENYSLDTSSSQIQVTSRQSSLNVSTQGVGLRQAFSGKNSFLRPSVSLGYARQVFTNNIKYTTTDPLTSLTYIYDAPESKLRQDSAFASFNLQIKLTKTFKLNGMVQTYFPAFEFDEVKNNLKYRVGISWLF